MSSSSRPTARPNHMEMYKSPMRVASSQATCAATALGGVGGDSSNASPSWRDAYKKRCFDEFKKSRQKLVNRFRNFKIGDNERAPRMRDFLHEELEKIMLLEANTNRNLITVDEVAEIYEQMKREIAESAEYSDEQLEELIRQQELSELDIRSSASDSVALNVVCPVCQKANLIEERTQQVSRLFCPNAADKATCNFKLDTSVKGSEMLTLQSLGERLEAAMRQHECSGAPRFQFKSTQDTIDANELVLLRSLSSLPSAHCFLLMSCDLCQFMQLII